MIQFDYGRIEVQINNSEQIGSCMGNFTMRQWRMPHGIKITITRLIERRERRSDEIGVCIWTGHRKTRVDSLPESPKLAYLYGNKPRKVVTRIEFLPPGVIPFDGARYRRQTMPKLRAMGLIRDLPANATQHPDHAPSDAAQLVAG